MPIYKDTKRFAKHKALFKPHIKIAASDYHAIAKLHPRDNFAKITEQLDISVRFFLSNQMFGFVEVKHFP